MDNTDFFVDINDNSNNAINNTINNTIKDNISSMIKEDNKNINNIIIDESKINNIVEVLDVERKIPNGYIRIDIESTKGKLNAPSCLHFRNFYLEDVKELVQYTSGNQFFQRVLSVLTSMNYEKFDCSKLHIEELKEIMIKLYLNFISKSLKDMKYKIDENKELEGNNIGKIDIDLTKLNIKTIDSNVKGKFTLKIEGSEQESVTFSFPQIGNIVLTSKLVDDILGEEKVKIKEIESKVKRKESIVETKNNLLHKINEIQIKLNSNDLKEEHKNAYIIQKNLLENEIIDLDNTLKNILVSDDDIKFLNDFRNKENTLYLEIYQKLSIEKINGKELTISEKINSKIDFRYYLLYNQEINKHKFGINDIITFYCPHNKKEISRRFHFRIYDFIPSLELQLNIKYDINYD